ncbi:hypothetical protein [Reichenbachiella sp.]
MPKRKGITTRNQILAGRTVSIYTLGSLLYLAYMVHRFGNSDIEFFLNTSLVLFLVFFIPHLAIHLNYYYSNKNDSFGYDDLKREVSFERDGLVVTYELDKVESLTQFRSGPFAEKRARMFPWDKYNYSIVRFNSGEEILITSLLVPQLELDIDDARITLNKRFYCWSPKR